MCCCYSRISKSLTESDKISIFLWNLNKWPRWFQYTSEQDVTNGILLIALYNEYSSSICDTIHSQCSHHEFNCALIFGFLKIFVLVFVWMLRNVHTQQYIIGWHYDPAASAFFEYVSKRCPVCLFEMMQNYYLIYFRIVQAIHDVNISAKSTFVSI